MQRYNILKKMMDYKLAVVIRGKNESEALKTAEACYDGGIRVLEVTLTVSGADTVMKQLINRYEDAVVGGGTVLDSETARIAILAGAEFIVSPAFDEATARLCNRYHIPYMPGFMTVNELITASEFGVEVNKLFPGQMYTPSFISNLKGPLPQVNIMPTGGINLDNVQDWLDAGAVMVGVGGEITNGAKSGDFASVTEEAAKFVRQIGRDA